MPRRWPKRRSLFGPVIQPALRGTVLTIEEGPALPDVLVEALEVVGFSVARTRSVDDACLLLERVFVEALVISLRKGRLREPPFASGLELLPQMPKDRPLGVVLVYEGRLSPGEQQAAIGANAFLVPATSLRHAGSRSHVVNHLAGAR